MESSLASTCRLGTFLCSLVVTLFALEGCGSSQSFTKASVRQGARVGVVSLLQPEITNFHLGFTAFTNFNKRLPNDWNLDQSALTFVKSSLKGAGYEVVDVRLTEQMASGIVKEEDWSDQNYSGLDKEWAVNYRDLIAENHLDALVVLREKILYMGDGRYTYHGFGVFSAHVAELFASTTADVISGDPPHRSIDQCVTGKLFEKTRVPVDVSDMQPADVPWMKPELEALIQQKLAFDLGTSGLIKASQPCPGFSRTQVK